MKIRVKKVKRSIVENRIFIGENCCATGEKYFFGQKGVGVMRLKLWVCDTGYAMECIDFCPWCGEGIEVEYVEASE